MKGLEIKTAGMKALEESVLFRSMTKQEILEVIDAMDPKARRFQKKDMILQDGELVGSMMIVLSGKIHLFHIDPNGNSNLLSYLRASSLQLAEWLAEAACLLSDFVVKSSSPLSQRRMTRLGRKMLKVSSLLLSSCQSSKDYSKILLNSYFKAFYFYI